MKLQIFAPNFKKNSSDACNLNPKPLRHSSNINKNYMDVEVLGVMIPIIGTIGLFTMIIYLRRFENQERMAMIEKGVSPELFNKKKVNNSGTLRGSLLLIGIGTGILLGYFLDRMFNMEEVGYFSMLFILGGLGLGAAYLIEEKKLKNMD
jgi:F0F1-type ATP synthase assembly protein I